MDTKVVLSLLASAAIVGVIPVPGFAHGKPEHGGAFTEVRDYTFEVVSKEQGEENEENEKKPHIEKMAFTVYVKDPSLKAVTAGSGSLKVSEGNKQVAEAPLSASGNAFTANADLPHHGRYRVAIDFTPNGNKPLKASVPIKVY